MNGQSPASLTGNGITPVQQMVSSCSGAFLTSLFGEIFDLTWFNCAFYTFEQTGHIAYSSDLFIYLGRNTSIISFQMFV